MTNQFMPSHVPFFGAGSKSENPIFNMPPAKMFEAAAVTTLPEGVNNGTADESEISLLQIAGLLFDNSVELASRLVKELGVTEQDDGNYDADDFYTALSMDGIPDDIEQAYEVAPMSEKRVADEFFNGNTGQAEAFLKKAKLKPDTNGRYDYNGLIGAMADSDTVFTESARAHAKEQANKRAMFKRSSSVNGRREASQRKEAEAAKRKAAQPSKLDKHDQALLESVADELFSTPRKPAKAPLLGMEKNRAEMMASTGINRNRDSFGFFERKGTPVTYSLMTESAPDKAKMHLDKAIDVYFGGSMLRCSQALRAAGLSQCRDSNGHYMKSELAYAAKHF